MFKVFFLLIAIALAFASGAAAHPGHADHFNPDWLICEQTSDCTVERGVCEAPTPVSKNHQDDLKHYAGHVNALIDCALPIDPKVWQSGAFCRHILDEAILCRDHRCGFNRAAQAVVADLKSCAQAHP